MAFLFNDQYQTRTSSYHSTPPFDPEDSFQKFHSKEHSPGNYSNPWRVTEEDELTYHHQQNPFEYSVAPQQESIPLTWKNLENMKLESHQEKLDRIYYWLKQSANASPPDSGMKPPSNDWNRKKLVPKFRIAPPRSVAGDGLNQDCSKELNRNFLCDYDDEPVPVRSPAWSDNFRKSAGQKRKQDQEEGFMEWNGQNSSWQSMKTVVTEDRALQSSYEEDNGLCFTRYEESVYETRTSRRVRLNTGEDYGTPSTEAKRQARVKRFQNDLDFLKLKNPTHDERNCSLDEIITRRITSRKQIRNVRDNSMMYESVPPALLPSPPKLEMKPYDYGSARPAYQGPRRPIVIDGSNVAYEKSSGKYFDSNGIRICVDWFLKRGFTDIVVVVPEYRQKKSGCHDPEPLRKLQRENKLVTCWSRKLPNGKRVASYDDRMIVEIADRRGGVIISNDRYRDLQQERPDWGETIGTRVVGFRFMPGKTDEIMFPEDPFGRCGPRLEDLLRF